MYFVQLWAMLNWLSYLNMWNGIDDTSFFDTFNKCISGTVVCYRQTERIFRFDYLDFFRPPFAMGKYEIVQANLSAQQLRHVNFMGI